MQEQMDLLEKQHVGLLGSFRFAWSSLFLRFRPDPVRYICDVLDLNNEELNLIVVEKFLAHALLGLKVEIFVDTCVQSGGEVIVLPCVFYYKVVGPF